MSFEGPEIAKWFDRISESQSNDVISGESFVELTDRSVGPWCLSCNEDESIKHCIKHFEASACYA
jgi:hypothetical protein